MTTGLLRNRRTDDEGAVLAMVAITMIVFIAAAALTIDLGNGWRIRRALIPATDAAALAVAQDFVNGINGCAAGTAQTYVLLNEPNADIPITCDPAPNGVQGRVSVTATRNVQTWFATAFGAGDFTASSTSTAAYGPPAAVTGLRPIGLCLDSDPTLTNAVTNPPAIETPVTITYAPPTAGCGSSTPRNWGIIDFAEANSGQSTISRWIRDGYPQPVSFNFDSVTSCPNGEPHCYDGFRSSLNDYSAALSTLKSSGRYFTVPVFDYVEGHHWHREFHIVGIVRVRLIDFDVTNPDWTKRNLELGVLPGLITGTCCGNGSGASGNRVITICGVDPGAYAACPST